MSSPLFLGVSLKAYFGQQETLHWCRQVAEVVGTHPAVVSGAIECVVLPSHPFLPAVREIFDGLPIVVGAQDVSAFTGGAYTGEVTAAQLKEIGVDFVEIGHAERREHLGEDDGVIANKMRVALDAGLRPLLCVGEQANRGPDFAAQTAIAQIEAACAHVSDHQKLDNSVIAYEPVWAIGEAEAATSHHIVDTHRQMREFLDSDRRLSGMRIAYGGSAGPGLYSTISPDVRGLFLGRFAHNVDSLRAIVDEVAHPTHV